MHWYVNTFQTHEFPPEISNYLASFLILRVQLSHSGLKYPYKAPAH